VGPRAGLDAVARTDNPRPSWESNPDCTARKLVTKLTEIWPFKQFINFSDCST